MSGLRTKRVLRDIDAERDRQLVKWGPQTHPDGTGPLIRPLGHSDINLDLRTGEELARIFRARCDLMARTPETDEWASILLEETFEALAESDRERLRKELVQVAAVAVAWVEDLDSREGS